VKYELKGHVLYTFNERERMVVNMCATLAAQRLPPEVEPEVVYLYRDGNAARLVFAYYFLPKEGAVQWIDTVDCALISFEECPPEGEGAACEVDWYIDNASHGVSGSEYFAEGVFIPGELIHGLVVATPSPNCRCLYRAVLFPYAPKARLFVDLDVPGYRPLLEEIFDKLEKAGFDVSRDRAVLKELEDPSWEEWAEERCRRLAAETAMYSFELELINGRATLIRTRETKEAAEMKARYYFRWCPKWHRAALEGIRRRLA